MYTSKQALRTSRLLMMKQSIIMQMFRTHSRLLKQSARLCILRYFRCFEYSNWKMLLDIFHHSISKIYYSFILFISDICSFNFSSECWNFLLYFQYIDNQITWQTSRKNLYNAFIHLYQAFVYSPKLKNKYHKSFEIQWKKNLSITYKKLNLEWEISNWNTWKIKQFFTRVTSFR